MNVPYDSIVRSGTPGRTTCLCSPDQECQQGCIFALKPPDDEQARCFLVMLAIKRPTPRLT